MPRLPRQGWPGRHQGRARLLSRLSDLSPIPRIARVPGGSRPWRGVQNFGHLATVRFWPRSSGPPKVRRRAVRPPRVVGRSKSSLRQMRQPPNLRHRRREFGGWCCLLQHHEYASEHPESIVQCRVAWGAGRSCLATTRADRTRTQSHVIVVFLSAFLGDCYIHSENWPRWYVSCTGPSPLGPDRSEDLSEPIATLAGACWEVSRNQSEVAAGKSNRGW